MLALLLLACAADDPCVAGPPTPPPAVLYDTDSCGSWALGADDHLVFAVGVADHEVACEVSLGAGLSLWSDPIYTSLGDRGPRRVFDVVAERAERAELIVTCDDGGIWRAWVTSS